MVAMTSRYSGLSLLKKAHTQPESLRQLAGPAFMAATRIQLRDAFCVFYRGLFGFIGVLQKKVYTVYTDLYGTIRFYELL